MRAPPKPHLSSRSGVDDIASSGASPAKGTPAAEAALEHQFLEQHYDQHRHEWTPMEVMTRMEELLAMYAPAVLAKVKRTGSFDLL